MGDLMKLLAFGLTADYDGTTEADGEPVDKFQGGVLQVGGADFHVRDTLSDGGGAIVVYESDRELIDILDMYPALKRIPVPDGEAPVNPFARQSLDALRHLASLRDFERYGSHSRDELAQRLELHMVALSTAQLVQFARGVREGDGDAIAAVANAADLSLGDPESSDDDDGAVVPPGGELVDSEPAVEPAAGFEQDLADASRAAEGDSINEEGRA